MPDYRILIAAAAACEYDGLPESIRRRVQDAIDGLAAVPRPRGTTKLKGSSNLFRIRIGDYRVIFHVSDRDGLALRGGRKGGLATMSKYGASHYRKIGQLGALARWGEREPRQGC